MPINWQRFLFNDPLPPIFVTPHLLRRVRIPRPQAIWSFIIFNKKLAYCLKSALFRAFYVELVSTDYLGFRYFFLQLLCHWSPASPRTIYEDAHPHACFLGFKYIFNEKLACHRLSAQLCTLCARLGSAGN